MVGNRGLRHQGYTSPKRLPVSYPPINEDQAQQKPTDVKYIRLFRADGCTATIIVFERVDHLELGSII